MNFIERVKGIISEPKKNMNNISEQPMIEEAVMIIGIYAILTAIAAYIQSYKITYVFEGLDDMPSSMVVAANSSPSDSSSSASAWHISGSLSMTKHWPAR